MGVTVHTHPHPDVAVEIRSTQSNDISFESGDQHGLLLRHARNCFPAIEIIPTAFVRTAQPSVFNTRSLVTSLTS